MVHSCLGPKLHGSANVVEAFVPNAFSFRPAADTAAATTEYQALSAPPPSGLCFDFDFGLHRIRNETLLVRGMVHLLDLLHGRLFFTGEFEPRL